MFVPFVVVRTNATDDGVELNILGCQLVLKLLGLVIAGLRRFIRSVRVYQQREEHSVHTIPGDHKHAVYGTRSENWIPFALVV